MNCKVHKNKKYRTTSIVHLNDKNLSLKARGLLSTVLSLPDSWNYTINGLVAICLEQETTIKTALDELKKKGYLVVNKFPPCKENGGRWSYDYNFYEEPIQDNEKQDLESLGLESVGLDNHTLYNNILSKDNISYNTNNTIISKDIIDNKKINKKISKSITKKEQLKNELILVINQFFLDEDIISLLEDFILGLFEINKLPSCISFKTSLNDLKQHKKQVILETIKKSIKANYNTFYVSDSIYKSKDNLEVKDLDLKEDNGTDYLDKFN